MQYQYTDTTVNTKYLILLLVQFSSVPQSCLTLCDSMNRSTPGIPIHHQLLESTQTHVHWVSDAIQACHPLLSPSPPTLNLSQHQVLFKCVSSSHQVAKVLEFQLQHQELVKLFSWSHTSGCDHLLNSHHLDVRGSDLLLDWNMLGPWTPPDWKAGEPPYPH